MDAYELFTLCVHMKGLPLTPPHAGDHMVLASTIPLVFSWPRRPPYSLVPLHLCPRPPLSTSKYPSIPLDLATSHSLTMPLIMLLDEDNMAEDVCVIPTFGHYS